MAGAREDLPLSSGRDGEVEAGRRQLPLPVICAGQASVLRQRLASSWTLERALPFGFGDRARASPPLPCWCQGHLVAGAGTHLVEGVVGVAEVNVQHGPDERQRRGARWVTAPLLPALHEVKKQSKDCKEHSQYGDVAPAG